MPFTPKCINMHFLRRRSYSYIITVQLIKSGNFMLIQHLIHSPYSNIVSLPNNVLYCYFLPGLGFNTILYLYLVVISLLSPLIGIISLTLFMFFDFDILWKVQTNFIVEWASIWIVQSFLVIRFRLCISFCRNTSEVVFSPSQYVLSGRVWC